MHGTLVARDAITTSAPTGVGRISKGRRVSSHAYIREMQSWLEFDMQRSVMQTIAVNESYMSLSRRGVGA